MVIKVAMFDFGGVLVKTEDQSSRAAWENRLGLKPGELSYLVFDNELAKQATLGKATEDQVWNFVGIKLGLKSVELSELREDFWAGDRFDSGLASFIASLRPQFKTALLSNAWTGARQMFTDRFQLDKIMDEIFVSAELGVAKPVPEIYRMVVERLGVRPDEIVFVDDYPPNITGAQVAGIQAIQYKSTREVLYQLTGLLGL